MENIVLTGFMGAGKSAVGRALAKKTGMKLVDTDELVEKKTGMKIADIFKKFGEEHFRALEKQVVEKVSELENHVIVTGGGVVLKKENMENLRRKGVIVYLHAKPDAIYERVKHETHRPLLQVENPMKKIKEMLEHRAQFYANNDFMVDTSELTTEEAAEEILKKLQALSRR